MDKTQIIQDFEWLHAHPELSYEEFETTRYIRAALTEAGVEAAFPQCTIAPAAEGTPIFVIPRNNRPQPPEKTTDAAPLPAET